MTHSPSDPNPTSSRTRARSSLRMPLLLATALIIAAIVALAVYDAFEARAARRAQIATEVRTVMEGFAHEQDRVLEDTERLLAGLAAVDVVRDASPGACDALLRSLRDQLRIYRNFFVADAEGDVPCLTMDVPAGLNVGDRAYFRSARATLAPAVDSYVIGRVVNEPLLISAVPLVGPEGAFRGMIGASVDLSWFGRAFGSIAVPEGSSILMFDAAGTVLASRPSSVAPVGAMLPDRIRDLTRTSAAGDSPMTRIGLDGSPRLFMATSVSARIPGVSIAVGVPESTAFADIEALFRRDVAIVVGLGLLVLLGLTVGLDRGVFARLDRLVEATGRIAGGDYSARAGTRERNDEIGVVAASFDHMATALERQSEAAARATAELAEREQRFRLLAENMSDLVALHAPDGTYQYVSPSVRKLLGYEPDELIGTDPYQLFHPDDTERVREESHARAVAGEYPVVIRYRIRRADDAYVWFETTTMPVLDESGELTHLQTASRDVDARVRAEEQRERLLAMLERSNRELQEFAYVASHDLQEPLRKIRAFGDRLVDKYGGALDDRGADYLARMQSAAERMQRLIEDLLTYSRVETQAQPFERTDLSAVVETVLDDLSMRIGEASAEVRVDPLPEIDADPVQMHRLFQNLLGNAIKYRRDVVSTSIEVRVRSAELEGEPAVEIQVADNGIGFAPEQRVRIFGMFQRLHGRTAYEGTGVGLAVCRRIVDRHGGTIDADARPDEGATFTVRLPLSQPTDPMKREGANA